MEKTNKKKKVQSKTATKKNQTKKIETKKVDAKQIPNKTEIVTKKEEQKKVIKKEEQNVTAPISKDELGSFVKIILAVAAIFLVFYGITTLVTKEPKEKENKEEAQVSIQYDDILLGNLMTQPNKEYYCLITEEDDPYINAYSTYMSIYNAKNDAIRVYTANLDSGFNKTYKAEETVTNIKDIKELKLSESTLVKIKDKKIVSVYQGNAKIIEHLKSITK